MVIKLSKTKIHSLASLLIIGIIFITISHLIQSNFNLIESYINHGLKGMIIFVFFTITTVVIAPVSTIPLIPLAAQSWGWMNAALLTITGWGFGSTIAFFLGRRYGLKIIKKLIPIKKMQEFEKYIFKDNLFWSIVFLRVVLPVNLLSYYLGIFSKIDFKRYLLATLTGLIPLALLISYAGTLPWYLQSLALATILIIFIVGIKAREKKLMR